MSDTEESKFWIFKGRLVVKNSKIVSAKVFSYSIDSAEAEELAESRILSDKCDGLIDLLGIRNICPEFVGLIEGKVVEDGDAPVVYISRIHMECPPQ